MTDTPTLPESAPFTPEQRAWVNGYLAGLFAQSRPETGSLLASATRPAGKPLLILYGSQTGSAEGIARKLAREAESKGFSISLMEANSAASYDWTRETNLLLITSTWGDGEPPDNAADFFSKLSTDSFPKLTSTRFSILALGDKNYSNFCGAGKAFDERFEKLGAKRIIPRVDCDTDYDQQASAWIASVLDALKEGVLITEMDKRAQTLAPPIAPSKSKPIQAALITNRRLNTIDSIKDTRHFEINLESGFLEYEPGDALGVMPQNCPQFVAQILQSQKWSGDEMVKAHDGAEYPIKQALQEKLLLTKLPAPLVQTFAQRAEDSFLSGLFEHNNPEALTRFTQGRDVLDLFGAYPFIQLSPQEFVSAMSELKPRLYSISSSQKLFPKQVHLTVNIVRYEAYGRLRKGVCSSFLADSTELPKTVGVYLHKSPAFRLPANNDAPVIMIGPGTGIAPFRAFLQERHIRGAKGKNWLFFGDQRAASDFLYKDELDQFAAQGILSRLSTAFSRDQSDKIYVQHRMLEQAREFYDWLENGAHLYVCGDASRMAKDVDGALHQIISSAGGKSEDQSKEYVAALKQTKRYLRDVY